MVAEAAVWIVQFGAMREIVSDSFKRIEYLKIISALVIGTILTYGAKLMNGGNFVTLVFSSILFFGGYACTLIILKEPLLVEILRSVFKKKKL